MAKKTLSNKTRSSLALIFLILLLPLLLYLSQKTITFLIGATGQKADIIVNADVPNGKITPIWQYLAQGGEEKDPFRNVINEISNLKPKYIRIDHIYDFYNIVSKQNGVLSFDFSNLDRVVDQILITGAIPLFSLSYMPPAIAQNGDILNPPDDWNDWQQTVYKTVEHFSGVTGRNIPSIIYEVWNEPDLFGGWKIGGNKDYRQLYRYAATGASLVQNVNQFKIGGPGTTSPYKNWTAGFLDYVSQNQIRLDFLSWHRYSQKPETFLQDVKNVDSWISQSSYGQIEKYITEWGSNSENSSIHDGDFDAAHLVAVSRQLTGMVKQAYVFEIKDGPGEQKYWGRWGLLTHENFGPSEQKPKYKGLLFLNQLYEDRLQLLGEGTWVTGLASRQDNSIKILLTNLDSNNSHYENVPLKIAGLVNGSYLYTENYLNGTNNKSNEIVTEGILSKSIIMSPNNIVLIEVTSQ